MDTDEVGTKIKGWISKGAQASKNAIEKAGDKVQDFTDKSVLKIEKKQLENKCEDNYLSFGKLVSKLMADGGIFTGKTDEDTKSVKTAQDEIISLQKQIAEKTKEINS